MNLLNRVKRVLMSGQQPKQETNWLAGVVTIMVPMILVTMIELSRQPSALAQVRPAAESPERDAAPRRSSEADAPRRRSAEAERNTARNRQDRDTAETRRDGDRLLPRFEPQNERERALLGIISQLREEIAQLRREISTRSDSQRDGQRDAPREIQRDAPRESSDRSPDRERSRSEFVLPDRWQQTRDGKVFAAYDKNHDQFISLDEWLAMTNGNLNDERRALQTRRFRDAEPSGDDRFTPREFLEWYGVKRHQAPRREGDRVREGDRR